MSSFPLLLPSSKAPSRILLLAGLFLLGSATVFAQNPVPTITSLSPTTVIATGGSFVLTVTGSGFVSSSTVLWNGSNRATILISATQLTAFITADDVALPATVPVTVSNPAPGGGTSAAATVTVSVPTPSLVALAPSSATAGGSGFTLTVNGLYFLPSAIVRWNGTPRATTYVDSTKLTATITAADIVTVGTATVTVLNPGNINISGAGVFTIIATPVGGLAPFITSIVPSTALAGTSDFILTVNGSNFEPTTVVHWNGNDRATTFVSSAALKAQILASDVATASTFNVSVYTPPPGAGGSNSVLFTINTGTNPAPTLSLITPSIAVAGSQGLTLLANGSGFVAGSTVRWNGNNRSTSFLTTGQLLAVIPAGDLAANGTAQVSVFNPLPGGGTSSTVPFLVTAGVNPVPTLSSLQPSSAAAGTVSFSLIVNGSNFAAGAVVRWNNSDRPTTYLSSTQLSALIPASDVAATGTAPVTVFNPAPGGGLSTAQTFTVQSGDNPAPAVLSIVPSDAVAGGTNFTLVVKGLNFVAGSVVRWNGSDRSTLFASSSELDAAITADDVASAMVAGVTVFNPAPGGGSSNSLGFELTTGKNPPPSIFSIIPTSANAGSTGLTLTVSGGNFVAGSVLRWNGMDRSTLLQGNSQLVATIPASDLLFPGAASIIVFNPGPGGGISNLMGFQINAVPNSVPALASVSPSSANAGSVAFALAVSGSNFVPGSVIQWNGGSRTTTFISSSQLTAAIPASDIAVAGTAQITVFNPAPAGGTSNALPFTVIAVVVAPSVSSLSPSSATAGGADFTLTVTGSNFTAGSVVRWNGSDRATTFVSSSQLSATITAADIAAPGTAQVTVNNSAGLSNAVAFTVTAAVCTGTAEPNLSINLDTGFYIAEVRNADGTTPGFWGMSVVTLSGQLVGGFNLGGGVKENGAAPAFGSFYISEAQTVSIDLRAQAVLPGDPAQLSVSVRLLDSNRNQIGTDQFGTSAVLFSRSLAAGFYIVEVRTGANSPRANFQLGLAAPFFSTGINTGGFVSAGQVGFGAFYVPVPQTAQISVLGASGFGSGAASCLRLRLLDAQRNVIQTVP